MPSSRATLQQRLQSKFKMTALGTQSPTDRQLSPVSKILLDNRHVGRFVCRVLALTS